MNQEKCAITAARMIKSVDDHHQKLFIEGLLAGLSEAQRLQWMQLVCEMSYPDLVWNDLEMLMEKKFEKDMKKTPMGVASMCRHYFGINPKMMPFLIKTAQRIKMRVRMRRCRHPRKSAGSETGEA